MENAKRFVLNFLICIAYLVHQCSVCCEYCDYDRCLVKSPCGTFRGLHKQSVLYPYCDYCAYTDMRYATASRFGVRISSRFTVRLCHIGFCQQYYVRQIKLFKRKKRNLYLNSLILLNLSKQKFSRVIPSAIN